MSLAVNTWRRQELTLAQKVVGFARTLLHLEQMWTPLSGRGEKETLWWIEED